MQHGAFKKKPEWLTIGLALKEHLPLEKELEIYKNIPKAKIDHEWFRTLIKAIRNLVKECNEEDTTTFYFENGILQIECNKNKFVVGAKGNDWNTIAVVKSRQLDFLPKRLYKRDHVIFIRDSNLIIDNRAFEIQEIRVKNP